MPREQNQKIKLLCMHELLKQESDEQHPLKTNQIIARMAERGIPLDRRTLAKDIQLLNEFGFEVMRVFVGHECAYYVEDRSFSVPELKILVDAVQAASFITEKKSNELTEKIGILGGTHRQELLTGSLVLFNTRKHANESVYYTVDTLEEAIREQKQAMFLYFDLDENRQKVYRRNGEFYTVEPVALIYNEDNYYLSCYSPEDGDIRNYRIDRMERVTILDKTVGEDTFLLSDDMAEYTRQAFKMYTGEPREIEIEFDDSLIGVVYDKFGENTKMRRVSENRCVATLTVQVSPTFWGWLFQFAGRMTLLAPGDLIEEYKERCKLIVNN